MEWRWRLALFFRTSDDAINQKIFEKSVDLLLVVDHEGTFVRVSPSCKTILGYEPVEMVGLSPMAFLHPDDLENTREMMRQSRKGSVTRHFDCRYIHRNKDIVLLTWSGQWAEEERQHFFIGRDITQARIAEQYATITSELDQIRSSLTRLEGKLPT